MTDKPRGEPMTCICGYDFPPLFLVKGEEIPSTVTCPICLEEYKIGGVRDYE